MKMDASIDFDLKHTKSHRERNVQEMTVAIS